MTEPHPQLKLFYFDFRGRAEPIRLAMKLGNISFTDRRFHYDKLDVVKEKLAPYGSVPLLQIGTHTAAQSDAILRYVGKLGNLYPEDPLNALVVDEVLDTCNDLNEKLLSQHNISPKEALREAREAVVQHDIPRYWGGLERRLAQFSSDGPFVLGEQVSIADLKITCFITSVKCGSMEFIDSDVLDYKYPKLLKVFNAVMALPQIAEWYKGVRIPGVNTHYFTFGCNPCRVSRADVHNAANSS